MNTKPIKIFISYCHENEIWLTQYLDIKKHKPNPKYLLDFWERSLRGRGVEFWYDRDEKQGIRGGDRWRNRIFEEIDNADIAILLITQDFIISPFIKDEELPRMLNRSKHGDLELLPILLEPARLKDLDIDNTFQIVPGRPTPLCEYFESENDWKKVRLEVIESIENVIEKVNRKRNLIEPTQLPKTVLISDESYKVKPPLTQNLPGESLPYRGKKLSWMMKTTTGPGKRSCFGMAYNDNIEGIILQGGYGSGNNNDLPFSQHSGCDLMDTWVWNGTSWQEIKINYLSLQSHSLAYNKSTKQCIIYGGITGSILPFPNKETILLDEKNWIKLDTNYDLGPKKRRHHAMAYDGKREAIMLFGGYTIAPGVHFIPMADIMSCETWEFKGSVWEKFHVNGPELRCGHQMVYDESYGVIVLFGGKNESIYFNDTWIWEGNSATWRKVETKNRPSARYSHGMTYDSLRKKVLLFGGKSESGVPLNDLWEWDGNDWNLLDEHALPKPRFDHGFVYDEKRNKSILFGGYDGKEEFQDTWEFTY